MGKINKLLILYSVQCFNVFTWRIFIKPHCLTNACITLHYNVGIRSDFPYSTRLDKFTDDRHC